MTRTTSPSFNRQRTNTEEETSPSWFSSLTPWSWTTSRATTAATPTVSKQNITNDLSRSFSPTRTDRRKRTELSAWDFYQWGNSFDTTLDGRTPSPVRRQDALVPSVPSIPLARTPRGLEESVVFMDASQYDLKRDEHQNEHQDQHKELQSRLSKDDTTLDVISSESRPIFYDSEASLLSSPQEDESLEVLTNETKTIACDSVNSLLSSQQTEQSLAVLSNDTKTIVFEEATDEDQVFFDSIDPKFSSSESSVGDSQIVVEEEATLEETAKDIPTAVSASLANSYSMVESTTTTRLPANNEYSSDTLQELKQTSTWPIKPDEENTSAIDTLRASMKKAKKKRRARLRQDNTSPPPTRSKPIAPPLANKNRNASVSPQRRFTPHISSRLSFSPTRMVTFPSFSLSSKEVAEERKHNDGKTVEEQEETGEKEEVMKRDLAKKEEEAATDSPTQALFHKEEPEPLLSNMAQTAESLKEQVVLRLNYQCPKPVEVQTAFANPTSMALERLGGRSPEKQNQEYRPSSPSTTSRRTKSHNTDPAAIQQMQQALIVHAPSPTRRKKKTGAKTKPMEIVSEARSDMDLLNKTKEGQSLEFISFAKESKKNSSRQPQENKSSSIDKSKSTSKEARNSAKEGAQSDEAARILKNVCMAELSHIMTDIHYTSLLDEQENEAKEEILESNLDINFGEEETTPDEGQCTPEGAKELKEIRQSLNEVQQDQLAIRKAAARTSRRLLSKIRASPDFKPLAQHRERDNEHDDTEIKESKNESLKLSNQELLRRQRLIESWVHWDEEQKEDPELQKLSAEVEDASDRNTSLSAKEQREVSTTASTTRPPSPVRSFSPTMQTRSSKSGTFRRSSVWMRKNDIVSKAGFDLASKCVEEIERAITPLPDEFTQNEAFNNEASEQVDCFIADQNRDGESKEKICTNSPRESSHDDELFNSLEEAAFEVELERSKARSPLFRSSLGESTTTGQRSSLGTGQRSSLGLESEGAFSELDASITCGFLQCDDNATTNVAEIRESLYELYDGDASVEVCEDMNPTESFGSFDDEIHFEPVSSILPDKNAEDRFSKWMNGTFDEDAPFPERSLRDRLFDIEENTCFESFQQSLSIDTDMFKHETQGDPSVDEKSEQTRSNMMETTEEPSDVATNNSKIETTKDELEKEELEHAKQNIEKEIIHPKAKIVLDPPTGLLFGHDHTEPGESDTTIADPKTETDESKHAQDNCVVKESEASEIFGKSLLIHEMVSANIEAEIDLQANDAVLEIMSFGSRNDRNCQGSTSDVSLELHALIREKPNMPRKNTRKNSIDSSDSRTESTIELHSLIQEEPKVIQELFDFDEKSGIFDFDKVETENKLLEEMKATQSSIPSLFSGPNSSFRRSCSGAGMFACGAPPSSPLKRSRLNSSTTKKPSATKVIASLSNMATRLFEIPLPSAPVPFEPRGVEDMEITFELQNEKDDDESSLEVEDDESQVGGVEANKIGDDTIEISFQSFHETKPDDEDSFYERIQDDDSQYMLEQMPEKSHSRIVSHVSLLSDTEEDEKVEPTLGSSSTLSRKETRESIRSVCLMEAIRLHRQHHQQQQEQQQQYRQLSPKPRSEDV